MASGDHLGKYVFGSDDSVSTGCYDAQGFRRKIETFIPKAVAFNGKCAGKVFLQRNTVEYGLLFERIGATAVFVLPSTSGTARRYWNEQCWVQGLTYKGADPLTTLSGRPQAHELRMIVSVKPRTPSVLFACRR